MKLTITERNMTAEQVQELVTRLENKEVSKGFVIRELFQVGMDVKEITKATGIRYNHVYNVVKDLVITQGLEVDKTGRDNENSKKNQIIRMLEEGKTYTEIATELRVLYNYVWQVAKKAGYVEKAKEAVVTPDKSSQSTKTTKATKKVAAAV